jgi:hypothetical protein
VAVEFIVFKSLNLIEVPDRVQLRLLRLGWKVMIAIWLNVSRSFVLKVVVTDYSLERSCCTSR